jgi:DNA-binding FadR family transcriptional regulator
MGEDPGIHKISKVRIFEEAVDQIREAILSGVYKPGDRLPTEAELSEMMAVGRSTVREALRVLEAQGLVDVRRGAGTFVSDDSVSGATRGEVLSWLAKREDSVIQILEVRTAIEWLTASLAALNRDDGVVVELREIVDEQWKLASSNDDPPDVDRLAELDVRFHVTISQASGNEIAHEVVSHIIPAFSEANRAILWVGEKAEVSIQEHEEILAGIMEKNPSKTEKAMRAHIERVRDEICDYLGEQCN